MVTEGKQWAQLPSERILRIFLETRETESPVGEVLRPHSPSLEDLRAVDTPMESAAVAARLKIRTGHRTLKALVMPQDYERV